MTTSRSFVLTLSGTCGLQIVLLILLPVSVACAHISYDEWSPQTELAQSVSAGDLDGVRALIGSGADVNATDSDARTALMWASICHSFEAARLLIEGGADVEMFDENGYTALHLAVTSSCLYDPPCDGCVSVDLKLVRLLVDAGSDVNAKRGRDAWTPLNLALDPYSVSIEVVALLLDSGADPTIASHCWAPMNLVAEIADKSWSHPDEPTIAYRLADMLLAAGADANHIHCLHGPPIAQAVVHEDTDFVTYLIAVGVDVNTVFTTGLNLDGTAPRYTALDIATEYGLSEIVKVLRAAGAQPASASTPR